MEETVTIPAEGWGVVAGTPMAALYDIVAPVAGDWPAGATLAGTVLGFPGATALLEEGTTVSTVCVGGSTVVGSGLSTFAGDVVSGPTA